MNILKFKYGDWRLLNQVNQTKYESMWWKNLKKVSELGSYQ